MELLQALALLLRQIGLYAMQKKCCLVEQPVDRTDVLDDDRLGQTIQLGSFLYRKVPSGVDDHGKIHQAKLSPDPGDQLEAGHVGKPKIQNRTVEASVGQCL